MILLVTTMNNPFPNDGNKEKEEERMIVDTTPSSSSSAAAAGAAARLPPSSTNDTQRVLSSRIMPVMSSSRRQQHRLSTPGERLVLRDNLCKIKLPFPWKLHQLLEDVECVGLQHVVSWLPNGQAFRVHKTEEFCKNIMTKYFKQTKFSSFTRQLYVYGFTKIEGGDDHGGYYHPRFNRADKSASMTLTRNSHRDRRHKQNTNNPNQSSSTADGGEESTRTTTNWEGEDSKPTPLIHWENTAMSTMMPAAGTMYQQQDRLQGSHNSSTSATVASTMPLPITQLHRGGSEGSSSGAGHGGRSSSSSSFQQSSIPMLGGFSAGDMALGRGSPSSFASSPLPFSYQQEQLLNSRGFQNQYPVLPSSSSSSSVIGFAGNRNTYATGGDESQFGGMAKIMPDSNRHPAYRRHSHQDHSHHHQQVRKVLQYDSSSNQNEDQKQQSFEESFSPSSRTSRPLSLYSMFHEQAVPIPQVQQVLPRRRTLVGGDDGGGLLNPSMFDIEPRPIEEMGSVLNDANTINDTGRQLTSTAAAKEQQPQSQSQEPTWNDSSRSL